MTPAVFLWIMFYAWALTSTGAIIVIGSPEGRRYLYRPSHKARRAAPFATTAHVDTDAHVLQGRERIEAYALAHGAGTAEAELWLGIAGLDPLAIEYEQAAGAQVYLRAGPNGVERAARPPLDDRVSTAEMYVQFGSALMPAPVPDEWLDDDELVGVT